jgi:4-amino-4-deoxy-L-arabinose transferase and related glycosyltransferases of PMT family
VARGDAVLIEADEQDAVVGPTAPSGRVRGMLERLPDLVGPATAGFGLPAMVLLLLGLSIVPLVILLGVVGATVATIAVLRGDPEPSRRRDPLWALLALAVAIAFFVYNGLYAAQNIYATRDPATYALAGQWLVHHHGILIPTHAEVFGNVPGVSPESAGFRSDPLHPADVYAQGNHLLPVLLGVGGWIAGPAGLFRVNCLVGALALLALFGLTRRFAGRAFALVAMVTLAVSMPMVAFSRDTYTEPLTLLLLFGGLSVLWRAVQTGRGGQFLVAGLVAGSSATARIDGYAALLAIIVAGAVLLAAARPGQRRIWSVRVALLLGGTALAASIGYLDVTRLSSGYYHDLRGNVLGLIIAAVGLAVLGAVTVLVAWWTPVVGWLCADRWRRRWSVCGSVGVVTGFAVLASRPLWTMGHGDCGSGLAGLQRGLGLPVDPCRTYYEQTVSWISWYFGWPMVVLAVLGLALLVYRMVWHRQLALVGPVGMVLALSALYLVDASNSPDQVWAIRRFLPVVIPGMLAAAGYLLYRLAGRGRGYRYVAVGLGLLMVGTAAQITYPVRQVRTGVPQFAQVRAICHALPDDAAVLSLGRSQIGTYAQAMRSFCNVPSAVMAVPNPSALARVRAAASVHDRRLYVIAEKADSVPFAVGVTRPAPFFVAHVTKLPERLMDVPAGPNAYDVPVFLGVVDPDGRVKPVPPA